MDGSLNEAGSIKEVVDLVLWFKDHSEHVPFAVTNLSKQDLILGFPWLCEHNPEVDWKTGEVKMSHRSQHCSMCLLAEQQRLKGFNSRMPDMVEWLSTRRKALPQIVVTVGTDHRTGARLMRP